MWFLRNVKFVCTFEKKKWRRRSYSKTLFLKLFDRSRFTNFIEIIHIGGHWGSKFVYLNKIQFNLYANRKMDDGDYDNDE